VTSATSAAYAVAPRMGSVRRLQRRAARLLVRVALGFAAGIAIAAAAPSLLGYQSFAVLSGSMAPALATGDVIVVNRIRAEAARVGDVVSFRSPDDSQKLITHRVLSVSVAAGSVDFVTKGDANTGVERWSVAQQGTIGRVEYRIPKLGYLTNRLGSKYGRLAFVALPALLLVLLELNRIWRPGNGGR
jgi:signal peptidase I